MDCPIQRLDSQLALFAPCSNQQSYSKGLKSKLTESWAITEIHSFLIFFLYLLFFSTLFMLHTHMGTSGQPSVTPQCSQGWGQRQHWGSDPGWQPCPAAPPALGWLPHTHCLRWLTLPEHPRQPMPLLCPLAHGRI